MYCSLPGKHLWRARFCNSQFLQTYECLPGCMCTSCSFERADLNEIVYRMQPIINFGINPVQEIAVIHQIPRTANIIARENIEVLVIDPATCFRIFPEEINREYNLTLESMRHADIFKDWPDKELNDICLVSKKNQVVMTSQSIEIWPALSPGSAPSFSTHCAGMWLKSS